MEKRVLRILADINDELLAYEGPNMVDDGIINSFELISIISELEEEFKISIDAEFVTEEHFGNKDCIIALIKRLTKNERV